MLVLLACGVTGGRGAMSDYCSVPPFLGNSVQPNVLVVLDNSGSMGAAAYPGSFDPAQFAGGHYYGYFEPGAYYRYADNKWNPTTDDLSTATAASPIANGDFLNWATMRRVDCAKKLLVGGKGSPRQPSPGVTVKLLGEDAGSIPNFTHDFDTTSAPGGIAPFSGNYRFSMSKNNLTVKPIKVVSSGGSVRPSGDLSVSSDWQRLDGGGRDRQR